MQAQPGDPAHLGASTGPRPSHPSAMELLNASRAGNADEVRRLLQAGADVHVTTPDGDTPLHEACAWCYPDVVRALVEAKADINARPTNGPCMGKTALAVAEYESTLGFAAGENAKEIARLLRELGGTL